MPPEALLPPPRRLPGPPPSVRSRLLPPLLLLWLPWLLLACGDRADAPLRFWAMGREGEVVQQLVADFEAANPDVNVEVQQIPWSAAHEKLLTAFVGRSTPDLAQLGNTWIAEFVALDALQPLDARVKASPDIDPDDYFGGVWETNRIDDVLYGVPWYVDTRVLFYREDLLARAGWDSVPGDWEGWRRVLRDVKAQMGEDRFAIFLPLNEWTQPAILGLQAGSALLTDHDTRGAFSRPPFRRGFHFYVDLFAEGLAPSIGNNEIANVYQEFARGTFAMYITGPWNLGEFSRRLPEELAHAWGTAPLPGPEGPASGVSLAGGASLVIFRDSPRAEQAWRLLEYLSRPEQQIRFYELVGDLPPRTSAWRRAGLSEEPRLRAFWEQLQRVVALPRVPEWELIALRLQEQAEAVVRGGADPDSALARLDRTVDRILEKRRGLLRRHEEGGGRP